VVLVDVDTAPLLREASSQLEWPVDFISVGPAAVQNTTSYEQLIADDGEGKKVWCPYLISDLFDGIIVL
jgi:hypothetical protein